MLAAILNSPNYLSPNPKAAGHDALVNRYDYVLKGMVSMGNLDASDADKYYGKLPKLAQGQGQQHVRGPARLHADDGQGRAAPHRLRRRRDRRRRPPRDDDVHPERDGRGQGRRARRAAAGTEEAARRDVPRWTCRPGHCWASTPARTTSTASSTGRRWVGRRDPRSSRSPSRPGSRPGSASRTPSTATRRTPSRTAARSSTRGRARATTTGSAITLTKATQESVNTAYSDLTESLPNGPEDILKMAVALGIPRKSPGLEANDAIALGSATISPINMANAYASDRQRRGAPRRVHGQAGDPRLGRQGALARTEEEEPGALRGHRRRHQLRPPAGGLGRHRRQRAGAGTPRCRQDRHGHQRRRRRVLVVVRRLHPPGRDRGDVRPGQGQRGAQRLPVELLRRQLPDLHLAGRDAAPARGQAGRWTSRRRRTSTATRPRRATLPTRRRRRSPRRPRSSSPSRTEADEDRGARSRHDDRQPAPEPEPNPNPSQSQAPRCKATDPNCNP